MRRLLRVLGIGKRAQQAEVERYAGQPLRTPASEESRSRGDQRRSSSHQTVAAPLSTDGKPAVDGIGETGRSSDSVGSDAGTSPPFLDGRATTELATGEPDRSPAQGVLEASGSPDADSPESVTEATGRSVAVPMSQEVDQVAIPVDQAAVPQEPAFQTPAAERGVHGNERFSSPRAGAHDRGVGDSRTRVDSLSSTRRAESTSAIAEDGPAPNQEEQPDPRSSPASSGAQRPEPVSGPSTGAAVEQPGDREASDPPASDPSDSGLGIDARLEGRNGSGPGGGEASEGSSPGLHGREERDGAEAVGRSITTSTGEPSTALTAQLEEGPAVNELGSEWTRTSAVDDIHSGQEVNPNPGLETPLKRSEDPQVTSALGHGTHRLEGGTPVVGFEPGDLAGASGGFGQIPKWVASEPHVPHAPETPSRESQDLADPPQVEKPDRSASTEPHRYPPAPEPQRSEREEPEWELTPEVIEPDSGLRDSVLGAQGPLPDSDERDSGSGALAPGGLGPSSGGSAPDDSGVGALAPGGQGPSSSGSVPDSEVGEFAREAHGPSSTSSAPDSGAGGLVPGAQGRSSGGRVPNSGSAVPAPNGEMELTPQDVEDVPPGLEPGLQEIVQRLVPPAHGRAAAPTDGRRRSNRVQGLPDGTSLADRPGAESEMAAVEPQDGLPLSPSQPSTETSVNHPRKENISPARSASKRGRGRMSPKSSPDGKHRPNVSRETLSFGEVADSVGEDEVLEDEAALAVREAALRAAAEVPGANDPGQQNGTADPQGKVSRETSQVEANTSGGPSPATPAVDKGAPPADEVVPTIDIERAARDARVTFQINHGAYNRFAIAVANQKGGVGKSTTAVNLGAYLALAGARVLVVDLDPQGNASTGLGLDHRQIEPSVYDVLMGDLDAASAIRQTPVRNLDVLPSTIDLAGAEVELVNAFSRETRLRQALGAVRYGYDLVFIDCPPSLGLLTVNALAAADELLIPIQCEYYALEGLGQLLRNVDLVRVNLNHALHIGGIVLTMYDGRTRLAEQVVQEVRKHFTDLVYQTVVPRSVRLSEAPGYGVPIALYDPLSRGGIAYRDLALELADRTGLLAPTREGAN